MSIEAWITLIAGAVMSAALAVYQIRYRNLGKITFLEEKFIPLFHDIVKSVPGLQVSYMGSNVNENLTLIKGALWNSGRIDIVPGAIEKPITIALSAGSKWVNFQPTSKSPQLELTTTVSDNKVVIETGLFRSDETIRFRALAELRDTRPRTAAEALQFSHRIANTRPVVKEQLPQLAKDLSRT